MKQKSQAGEATTIVELPWAPSRRGRAQYQNKSDGGSSQAFEQHEEQASGQDVAKKKKKSLLKRMVNKCTGGTSIQKPALHMSDTASMSTGSQHSEAICTAVGSDHKSAPQSCDTASMSTTSDTASVSTTSQHSQATSSAGSSASAITSVEPEKGSSQPTAAQLALIKAARRSLKVSAPGTDTVELTAGSWAGSTDDAHADDVAQVSSQQPRAARKLYAVDAPVVPEQQRSASNTSSLPLQLPKQQKLQQYPPAPLTAAPSVVQSEITPAVQPPRPSTARTTWRLIDVGHPVQ